MQKIDKKNRVEWYFNEKNSTIKQLKKEFGNENGNYGQPINSQEKYKTKIVGKTSNVQFKLRNFQQTRK